MEILKYNVAFTNFLNDFSTNFEFLTKNFYCQAKKKTTLVSRNASNKKNLHLGGHIFILFSWFPRDILFSSFVSFVVFFCILFLNFFLLVYFLKSKWYTFDYASGRVIQKSSTDQFLETRLLFFWPKKGVLRSSITSN